MTENSKAFYFSALSQLHARNSPKQWRHTLALLKEWACLWLFFISDFVCAAFRSSGGFAEGLQAFCLICRGGFCLALAAICWRMPFVLPLHRRFGHRSQITATQPSQEHHCLFLLQQMMMPRRMAGDTLYVSQGKEYVLSRGIITYFDGKELVLLESIQGSWLPLKFLRNTGIC